MEQGELCGSDGWRVGQRPGPSPEVHPLAEAPEHHVGMKEQLPPPGCGENQRSGQVLGVTLNVSCYTVTMKVGLLER